MVTRGRRRFEATGCGAMCTHVCRHVRSRCFNVGTAGCSAAFDDCALRHVLFGELPTPRRM